MNIQQIAALTADQIAELTGPQLVEAFNIVAPFANANAVAKFKDRATGIRRLESVMDVARKVAAASKKSEERKVRTARADSTAARIREMILAGKTNREILTELDLPSHKNHYPTWYRCQMRRAGIEVPTPRA
jgi:hypothetical protein